MCKPTDQNTINAILGTTAQELLGPNPRRTAILFNPNVGQLGPTSTIGIQAFAAGALQTWTVPQGVVQVLDMYAWGAGGNAGQPGAVLGGGGGGAGGFSTSGPQAVIPGTIWRINVDVHNGGSFSDITTPLGAQVVKANSGATPVLDAAGAAGAIGTGAFKLAGTAGFAATGLAGSGGGGGGAPGSFAAGTAAAGRPGGAGGGVATFSTYGAGGTGGDGGLTTAQGQTGTSPGAGGGGSGNTGPASGLGADGVVVIAYQLSPNALGISLSHRQDVTVGLGVLNFIGGLDTYVLLTEDEIGSAIQLPWWAISGVDALSIQIVEYLSEHQS